MNEEIKNNTQAVSKSSEDTDYLYIESLQFDPNLKKGLFYFFVKNIKVVFLLIMLVSIFGIYSFLSLPRESNPEVKIPMAVVSTIYPGVSPADIEELVTKKIETKISGVKGIKNITSNSANSVSMITVEFDSDQDVDDAIRRLRDQVNTVKSDLPEDGPSMKVDINVCVLTKSSYAS